MSTPIQSMPPEKKPSSINPWILGCVVVPVVLLVLLAIAGMMGWHELVRYGIASDFTEYQAKIRPMDLDPAVKKALLDRMERLREKARASPISFVRWIDYDSSIKSLLADDRLTPDEVEALNRELDRMEAEFH